jgi:eukaryotic-like serine/threonine-protein kinase
MSTGTTGHIDYFNRLIGKELNQNYRIDERLAVGGMGAVFKGTNLKQGDQVAIKVISPHLAANPVFVKRFQREARVGGILSHPHIVKVYEFGETEEGLLYMVMEFVEGETLADFLDRSAPLTVSRSLEILKPLSDALDTAHSRSILHRDLKPANVLMTKDKNTGKEIVKLTDFGLVKLLQPDEDITQGSNLTEVGEACGTPFYMSPEQIIGQPLNPTADIYSLGVMLYQMLTGKMPIEGNSVRQILALKINHDLAPPSSKFPFLPSTLDKVLQKVLARDPSKRYQTAGELLAAYQQVTLQITSEFSQATEPSLDKGVLADLRGNLNPAPVAASYHESPPTAKLSPLTTISGTYEESPPTSKLTLPPSLKESGSSSPDFNQTNQTNQSSQASQIKMLWITIAVLAILVFVMAVLLLMR